MKKLLIALVSLFSCGAATFAQSSLVATLTHNGEISTFYGARAFINAHAAAVNGDVINLSSGCFTATNITKAISIYGAGMAHDTIAQIEPTVISTSDVLRIELSENNTETTPLKIEGIDFADDRIDIYNLQYAIFSKCKFGELLKQRSISNIQFRQCRIADNDGSPASLRFDESDKLQFHNCIINSGNSPSHSEYINCVLTGNGPHQDNPYCTFKNCIITLLNPSSVRPSNATASSTYFNNLYICPDTHVVLSPTNTTNVTISPDDERVASLVEDYTNYKTYELNDEIRALIKGADGTDVGIHGGLMPYDPAPSNPRITKFNVAPKTTTDGKLNVEIEVSAAK